MLNVSLIQRVLKPAICFEFLHLVATIRPQIIKQSSPCIISYNSTGFNSAKQEFCRYLEPLCGDKIPIICYQENFLLMGNSYKVEDVLSTCRILLKGANKETLT